MAEILERWDPVITQFELVTGNRGVFRVTADSRVVFDKAVLRRFPEPGELAAILESDLGPPITWRKSRNLSAGG